MLDSSDRPTYSDLHPLREDVPVVAEVISLPTRIEPDWADLVEDEELESVLRSLTAEDWARIEWVAQKIERGISA